MHYGVSAKRFLIRGRATLQEYTNFDSAELISCSQRSAICCQNEENESPASVNSLGFLRLVDFQNFNDGAYALHLHPGKS